MISMITLLSILLSNTSILPLTLVEIKTERLILKPLSYSMLLKYVYDMNRLETELCVNSSRIILPDELKKALQETIIPNSRKYSVHSVFSTLWIIIDRKRNQIVGDFCFKGPPGESGEVEIGYGTYPRFMRKGIMTEAIQSVSRWALQQPGITAILAETDKDNV